MNLTTTATLAALAVLSVIPLAWVAGLEVPESILGLSLGTLAGIAGNAIASGKERAVIELPASYRVKKLELEVEET